MNMHPLIWGIGGLVVFIIVIVMTVFFSKVTCPGFGHGCSTADVTLAATPQPTTAPFTTAPVTAAPVTAAPYTTLYTELLAAPTDLSVSGQTVAPLPLFGLNPTAYTLSLWIRIPKVAAAWRTVVRFGPDDSQRMPALYIWPNSTNLHYRHATATDWNPGIDTIPGVPLDTWTHLAVTVAGRVLTPYLNGAAGPAVTVAADLRLPTDKVYFNPTNGQPDTTTPMRVARVWFYPRALSPDEVPGLMAWSGTGLS